MSKVVEFAETETIAELTTARLSRALALFGQGRKAMNRNKARGFFVHFFKWLRKQGLWDANPAELLERAPEHDRKRWRALTERDFKRLLASVPRYRRVIYLFAARTGLRRGAIKGLRWEDLDFENATVTTRVLRAKNRREKVKPLAADIFEELLTWKRERPGATVFPKMPRVATLKRDLEGIGLAKVTADGAFDFHSLKVQLATDLARNKAHPRVAMELLDHSDIRLTMQVYAKVDLEDQRNALDLLTEKPRPDETAEATGA